MVKSKLSGTSTVWRKSVWKQVLPENTDTINVIDRIDNSIAVAVVVDRLPAAFNITVVVDDDETAGRQFGKRFFSASMVDSYISPSSRSNASFSISTVGKVSQNQPLKIHLSIQKAVAVKIPFYLVR